MISWFWCFCFLNDIVVFANLVFGFGSFVIWRFVLDGYFGCEVEFCDTCDLWNSCLELVFV